MICVIFAFYSLIFYWRSYNMLELFITSAHAAAAPAQPNALLQILPMVAIFAIFYFNHSPAIKAKKTTPRDGG